MVKDTGSIHVTDADGIQREHFARVATDYDTTYANHEHDFALDWLSACMGRLNATSLLDVGAGTGRSVRTLTARFPSMRIVGVEPIPEMRHAGYRTGIPREALIEGRAEALPFPSKSFDVVTSFALLHHVPRPDKVIEEMMRVARVAVFVSDCNNFGQGSALARLVKNLLRVARLWRVYVYIRTRGRGFDVTVGDGAAYSFSLFDRLPQLRREFPGIYLLSTKPAGSSFLRVSTTHAAVLATATALEDMEQHPA